MRPVERLVLEGCGGVIVRLTTLMTTEKMRISRRRRRRMYESISSGSEGAMMPCGREVRDAQAVRKHLGILRALCLDVRQILEKVLEKGLVPHTGGLHGSPIRYSKSVIREI